ncbi:hypothetical protein [Oligella urethralis]|uniref:hypothetical protein n=1 Tax=Oligella urethralis TaxID=90245 RepID=UPI000E0298F0|nr:hypothetical protein [Oligella urethralis]SUA59748.1 Uncharacterised protein [Oligella urethralis]
MLKKIIVTLLLSLPLSVWAQPTSDISTQQDLINDLNAFANASCLAQQKDPYLQKTGYAWANALVQKNIEFSLEEVMLPIQKGIEKAIAHTTMYTIRDESAPMDGLELPIAYCFKIIQQTGIQTLIQKISKKIVN